MTSSPHRPAPTVVAGLVQSLVPHAPFSAMARADVEELVRRSRVAYFASGDTILAPSPSRPEHCYVIRQGAVRGESADAVGAEALFELGAGEMFALGALLGHRGPTSRYRAAQDTFCLVFAAADFDALVQRSPQFRDFCTRRLAYLLDAVRARVQAEYVGGLTSRRDMATPLADLVRGACCNGDAGHAARGRTAHDGGAAHRIDAGRRRASAPDRYLHAAGRDRPRRAAAPRSGFAHSRRHERARDHSAARRSGRRCRAC